MSHLSIKNLNRIICLASALVLLQLAGCGQKGALYFPEAKPQDCGKPRCQALPAQTHDSSKPRQQP